MWLNTYVVEKKLLSQVPRPPPPIKKDKKAKQE